MYVCVFWAWFLFFFLFSSRVVNFLSYFVNRMLWNDSSTYVGFVLCIYTCQWNANYAPAREKRLWQTFSSLMKSDGEEADASGKRRRENNLVCFNGSGRPVFCCCSLSSFWRIRINWKWLQPRVPSRGERLHKENKSETSDWCKLPRVPRTSTQSFV